MNHWLKLPLGLASLSVGGAVLLWSCAATVAALMKHGGCFSVVNLITAGIGCAAIGFGADCFGWMRSNDDEKKTPHNTMVHGSARPAEETEAQAAARGDAKTAPMHDATFPN